MRRTKNTTPSSTLESLPDTRSSTPRAPAISAKQDSLPSQPALPAHPGAYCSGPPAAGPGLAPACEMARNPAPFFPPHLFFVFGVPAGTCIANLPSNTNALGAPFLLGFNATLFSDT